MIRSVTGQFTKGPDTAGVRRIFGNVRHNDSLGLAKAKLQRLS